MAKQRLDVGPGLGLPVLHVPVRGRREELLFSIIILFVVVLVVLEPERVAKRQGEDVAAVALQRVD